MATGFEANIKPYFSEDDRNSMKDPDHTGGFTVDLWSKSDVQKYYGRIKGAIDSQSMPPGGWEDDKIKKFDTDFEAWKAGGFQN